MPDNRIAWGQICDIADNFEAEARREYARRQAADTIARFIRALETDSDKVWGMDETFEDFEARFIRAARKAAGLRDYSGNA
jgi:hypothetical protein